MIKPELVDTGSSDGGAWKIFRGPRPSTEEDFNTLRSFGIKTIINLEGGLVERVTRDYTGEEMNFDEAGERVYFNPMSALFPPSLDQVMFGLKILKWETKEGQSVYVHCKEGRDRTGVMIAAWRAYHSHWKWERIFPEMKKFGFHFWYFYWIPIIRTTLHYIWMTGIIEAPPASGSK